MYIVNYQKSIFTILAFFNLCLSTVSYNASSNYRNTNLHKRQSAQCSQAITRPEIRELSHDKRNRLFAAIKKLNDGGEGSEFNRLAKIHLDYTNEAHGVPAFLPWHRKFLSVYEQALQKIDPEVVIPYWDWSVDSQSPESSVVLSEEFYGGNGDGNDKCLKSGFFKDQQVHTPNAHCLKRDFDGGNKVGAFYSSEALEYILQQKDFVSFERRLEAAPHSRVHIGLGGTQGDIMTMYSTNDPVFFLHHAFIDLLWNEWQQRNPQANQYEGNNLQGAPVNQNDELKPFGVSVSETMSTQAYCYTYPRYAGKQVPSGSTPANGSNNAESNQSLAAPPTPENSNGGDISKRALLDSVKDLAKSSSKLAGNIVKETMKSVKGMLDELKDIKLDAFDRSSKNKNLVREPVVVTEDYSTRNNIPYNEMLEYQLEIKREVIDKCNAKYNNANPNNGQQEANDNAN